MCQVNYLGSIGGRDVADATRKVLRELLSTTLARKLNYAGNGEKDGIKDMRIRSVIIGKLMSHYGLK